MSLSNHERPFDKLRANELLCFSIFLKGDEEEFGRENLPIPIIVGFITLHFSYRLLSTLSPAS